MVYRAALEMRCPARDREFESPPLRHFIKTRAARRVFNVPKRIVGFLLDLYTLQNYI